MAESIVIKLYNHSRLYDGANGRYVSIDILRAWKNQGLDFTIQDAETGQDVTRVLMAQPNL